MRHHLVVEIDISIYSRYRSIANSNQCDGFAQFHAGKVRRRDTCKELWVRPKEWPFVYFCLLK